MREMRGWGENLLQILRAPCSPCCTCIPAIARAPFLSLDSKRVIDRIGAYVRAATSSDPANFELDLRIRIVRYDTVKSGEQGRFPTI